MVEEGIVSYLLKTPEEDWATMRRILWRDKTIQEVLILLIQEFNTNPELQEKIKSIQLGR
jgi:hypothetical protein